MITRRFFAAGAAAAIVAPAIVKFEALMPVRSMIVRQPGFTAEEMQFIESAAMRYFLKRQEPHYMQASSGFMGVFNGFLADAKPPVGVPTIAINAPDKTKFPQRFQ